MAKRLRQKLIFFFGLAPLLLGAGQAYGATGGTPSPYNHLLPAAVGGSAVRDPKPARPLITAARCVPRKRCPAPAHTVAVGGLLALRGRNIHPGMRVLFPRADNARISRDSPGAPLHRSRYGLVVVVPASAHSGKIVVVWRGRRSPPYGPLEVVRPKPKPQPKPKPTPAPVSKVAAEGTPFAGTGMWIWELGRSDQGNLQAIVAQARAAGLTTLFIKSGDGTSYWNQFSPEVVSALKAGGVRVCAWQYVYGNQPLAEAEVGALAVAHGAECFVIDAESPYEGRYAAAQRYLEALRAKIGPTFPLALTSFPYVDRHQSLPYSVFLGPNGAQFNLPQMYWKDIGITVPYAYIHTFEENSIYTRALCPLGQTFENPPPAQIVNFRSLAGPFGGCGGVSFWDWQETTPRGWKAVAAPLETAPLLPSGYPTSPLLGEGSKGDQVVWLQEHLAAAYPSQPTNGIFETKTVENLKAFQLAHGLAATGQTEPSTWTALLALPALPVAWRGGAKPAGG